MDKLHCRTPTGKTVSTKQQTTLFQGKAPTNKNDEESPKLKASAVYTRGSQNFEGQSLQHRL